MGLFDFLSKKKKTDYKLFYDTEVHCHILPGIDDGSPDVATSVELVRQMSDLGIRRIITTSHVTESTFENTPETIRKAYTELRSALDAEGIEMEIHTSAEYRMDEFFINQVKENNLLPFPENYILIENSFFQPFWDIKSLIFDLKLKGYTPILAHPERYSYYHNTPNIYKELHDSLGCYIPNNGYLVKWAKQGVLLLNTALTVRKDTANSHRGKGWEIFTDEVIKKLNNREKSVIFILWGSNAKEKAQLIDSSRHHILTSVHPSPLSASRGFFGCNHFGKANEILKSMGEEPVDWQIENI